VNEIERARQILQEERETVLSELREQRRIAEEAARAQREWRAAVQELLERGRTADLSVAEMADALGVSRQWANHLAKRRRAAAYRVAQEQARKRMGCGPPEAPSQPA